MPRTHGVAAAACAATASLRLFASPRRFASRLCSARLRTQDSGVAVIEGESVARPERPEVVYLEERSGAVSMVHALRVDTGLAWASAHKVWSEAVRDPLLKSTTYGGTTGFWRQTKSKRVVLAIEMPATATERAQRLHRILRPGVHTSSKPQYVPGPELKKRYTCVRDLAEGTVTAARTAAHHMLPAWLPCLLPTADSHCGSSVPRAAENLWTDAYLAEEDSRTKDVHLLVGCILPIWQALTAALREGKSARRESHSLPVKKCVIDGEPIIGVAMTLAQVAADSETQPEPSLSLP